MNRLKGYFSLDGLHPSGKGRCTFHVSKHFVEHLERAGPVWKFWNLHIVKEILDAPTAIFEGLNRIGYDSGVVYSGRVSKRIVSKGIEAPPPPDMVGVVIVNSEPRGHIVLDWNWRKEDLDRPGYPEHWQQDFEACRWTAT